MKIPRVRSYNPGSPNPNMMEVHIPGTGTIYYSYTTPVAYSTGARLFVDIQYHSATTSRHVAVLKRTFGGVVSTFDSERDFQTSMEGAFSEVQ